MPYERWRELGADGVVIGTVQKVPTGIRVELRLYNVRARASVFGREYTGSAANPRLYAHTCRTISTSRSAGCAAWRKTKLTFSSDRNREAVVGTVEKRDVKEVYVTDYDGANPRRITINRDVERVPELVAGRPLDRLHVVPNRRAGHPDLQHLCGHDGDRRRRASGQNWLPVFSPDGTKIAFTSNRDGNPELYVMNRDGSDLRRLTNNPEIDTTPTWSPNGTQIAFTSGRTGTPQIYVVGADGAGLAAHLAGVVRGSADLVAGAVQRDRVLRAQRTGLRHQGVEYRHRRDAADYFR